MDRHAVYCHIILADSAQVVDDRLYLLGGWRSAIGVRMPFALAIEIRFAGHGVGPHTWSATLAPADPGDARRSKLAGFDGEFVVDGRVLARSHPQRVGFAVNSGPLDIPPGQYRWQLTVDGVTQPSWSADFDFVGSSPDHG